MIVLCVNRGDFETVTGNKLDSNKIEAQKLELTKSTISQESRGQFHKLIKIIFILRMSQVTIDYHN